MIFNIVVKILLKVFYLLIKNKKATMNPVSPS